MIYLFVVGLVSILGQAVLLRELNVAFYGIDLIYTLALGVWLVWTAVGAVIGRRRLRPSLAWTHGLFFLFSLLLPADVVFVRSIRALFSEIPGAYLPFADQVLAMSAALLPIGLLSGLTFQWAAKLYIARGRTLASAYAIESAGGLTGGLCATLFLKLGVQNLTISVLCSLFALGAAWSARGTGSRWFRAAVAGATLLMLALVWRAGPVDRALTGWTHPYLLASQDTPYCRVTVTQQGGQIAVYENDALSFETEGIDAEVFVHMAALAHPQPKRVLILGGGIEGTVREILKHAPAQVDYVELNPALLGMVTPHLPPDLQEPLHASTVRVSVADARRFLETAADYDLILIGMPEPASGQANRFYTLEFFKQCSAHLNPGGILAFRLRSGENRWTPQQTARAVSIYLALKKALPEIQVLPGETNIFLASQQPLPRDPDVLASRFDARGIVARLVSKPYVRYVYTNDRFAQIAHILETGKAPLNTDVRPICYQYTLMIWLSQFYPSLTATDLSFLESWSDYHRPFLWVSALVVSALFLISRRRQSLRRALLVCVAGFVGMVFETLLVLHYQVKSGVLYQDIGVLLMSFMAGLALGALATDRWVFERARRMPLWYGPALIGGVVLLGLLTSIGIGWSSMAGLAETMGLLFVTGFLVAAVFAYASLEGVRDQGEVVAPLYAADLVGGCLGSLTSSLVLIPITGLATTAALMAPLALLSLLLLGVRRASDE